MHDEIENNLIIGLCNNFADKNKEQPSHTFLVADQQQQVHAALMVTAFRAILAGFSENSSGLRELAHYCQHHKIVLPGLFGHEDKAMNFLKAAGLKPKSVRSMMSHRLTELNEVPFAEGVFREANEGDKELLMEYTFRFQQEANPESKQGKELFLSLTEERLKKHDLFVWEVNDCIVSMAGIVRRTPSSCIIGLVYTPEDKRAKGYARACVHALSKRILSNGYTCCGLFTDLANPTSNHIYRQIGYVPRKKHIDVQF